MGIMTKIIMLMIPPIISRSITGPYRSTTPCQPQYTRPLSFSNLHCSTERDADNTTTIHVVVGDNTIFLSTIFSCFPRHLPDEGGRTLSSPVVRKTPHRVTRDHASLSRRAGMREENLGQDHHRRSRQRADPVMDKKGAAVSLEGKAAKLKNLDAHACFKKGGGIYGHFSNGKLGTPSFRPETPPIIPYPNLFPFPMKCL